MKKTFSYTWGDLTINWDAKLIIPSVNLEHLTHRQRYEIQPPVINFLEEPENLILDPPFVLSGCDHDIRPYNNFTIVPPKFSWIDIP